MSTTSTDCLQPNRKDPIQRKLAALLARDEARHRPPVTLPGQPTPTPSSSPQPAPPKRRTGQPALTGYRPQLFKPRHAEEPTDQDALATWTKSQLMRMDYRFSRLLERAFKRGKESRQAAANQIAAPRW